MLVTKMDEDLKLMGMAREIVNKVQKLRKTAGLNIDDQVEVFYEDVKNSNGSGVESQETSFDKVFAQHIATINTALKVPFLEKRYL